MNKNIIESIANNLSTNNKTLVIEPGSMLSTLNIGKAAYDSSFNGLDVKIASILSNEVNNIRNNIIPLIKEYGNIITKSLNYKLVNNVFKDVNIYSAKLPDVTLELLSRGVIKDAGDAVRTLSNKSVIIPNPGIDKIREYLIYGSGQMESLVNNFTMNISDVELNRIWDTYLANVTSDNSNFVTLGYKVNDGIYGLDLFVLNILVKKLLTEIPDNVRVSSGVYQDTILSLDAVIDAKIIKLENMLKVQKNLGKLIYKSNSFKEIIVIESVYNQYLKEDGRPEALYGYALDNAGTSVSIVNIKEKEDAYITRWNSYVSNENMKHKLSTVEHHRMAYRLGMTELVNNFMSEDLKEQVPYHILADIGDLVIEYMNSVNSNELLDVNKTVDFIIAKIMFKHTNTATFIGYMKEYSKMDNTLTPKQTATYASMDLILDYLLTQVTIK